MWDIKLKHEAALSPSSSHFTGLTHACNMYHRCPLTGPESWGFNFLHTTVSTVPSSGENRGKKKGMWIHDKFGDHRTGKGQFSFQSQRKAITKNVQTTTQLYSSHALAKHCSTLSKLGSNIMWTESFQIFQLDLKKAEEPESKLLTSIGSYKKQENSRETSNSALLTMPKPLTVWITTN